jgi:two-component system nitrogen regulation response regulator GlnG
MTPSILIVDDEQAVCWALERAFTRAGYRVAVAPSAEAAFDLARRDPPDAVVLDVRLPGMDGLTALARLRQLSHDAPVIVITAHGNLSTAVRAVEGGAFDYLAKPFDLGQALDTVARALDRRRQQLPAAPAEPVSPEEIVGRSPVMQIVFKRIALVAPTEACVLITGESGTGKELVARAVHRHSARRDRPFLPVHVAALSPSLVESELFGHVRGAFTGAAQSRPGLLSLAEGGTVFLDELADIPLPVQAKLLRVLEHQEVLPVGGNEPQSLNLRVLAATHQDLSRAVAEGRFRHDLYFRLNVFQIHLPPLRDRTEDIPLLAEHFLRRFAPQSAALPTQTVAFLQARAWPGNVRELRNALEHAAILARGGPLLPEHFPPPVTGPGPVGTREELAELVRRWVAERVGERGRDAVAGLYDELLACVEPALLDEVLRQVQDNRLVAARWLGLARGTVRKLIARYRAGEPDEEG